MMIGLPDFANEAWDYIEEIAEVQDYMEKSYLQTDFAHCYQLYFGIPKIHQQLTQLIDKFHIEMFLIWDKFFN